MSKLRHSKLVQKKPWFSAPKGEHIVQFYLYDDVLLRSLHEYVYEGLKGGDICIVVATRSHLEKLDRQLAISGVNTELAYRSCQYVPLSAVDTLGSLMAAGRPDRQLFFDKVGVEVRRAAESGRPIRAFGEMVGLLWKQNNQAGVIQLEELWNELAERYTFSLYCAYPEIQFDREIHQGMINKITNCHALVNA